MKVLIYSDIHHGVSIGKLGASGFDLRLEDTLKIEEEITDFCLKNNINRIVFLGDRFQSRNPSLWLVNLVDSYWLERSKNGIYVDTLIGNHDLYRITNYGTSYSSLWKDNSFIKIYDKPIILNNWLGKQVAFIPYGFDLSLIKNKVDIIFFHDEIFGFEDDRGYKSLKGFDMKEICNKCSLAIGGHIHSRVDFGICGIYVGAPYQIDKLDIEKSRGFLILDTDNLSVEFKELSVPKLVEFKIQSDSFEIPKDKIENNYVFCFVKSGLEKKVEDILNRLRCRYFTIHILKERGLIVENIARNIYQSNDDIGILKEYISSRDISNKDLIFKIGLDLWDSSLSL